MSQSAVINGKQTFSYVCFPFYLSKYACIGFAFLVKNYNGTGESFQDKCMIFFVTQLIVDLYKPIHIAIFFKIKNIVTGKKL